MGPNAPCLEVRAQLWEGLPGQESLGWLCRIQLVSQAGGWERHLRSKA